MAYVVYGICMCTYIYIHIHTHTHVDTYIYDVHYFFALTASTFRRCRCALRQLPKTLVGCPWGSGDGKPGIVTGEYKAMWC